MSAIKPYSDISWWRVFACEENIKPHFNIWCQRAVTCGKKPFNLTQEAGGRSQSSTTSTIKPYSVISWWRVFACEEIIKPHSNIWCQRAVTCGKSHIKLTQEAGGIIQSPTMSTIKPYSVIRWWRVFTCEENIKHHFKIWCQRAVTCEKSHLT